MKNAINVAIIIFTPIIVTLLLRLGIAILNFIDELFDLNIINTPDIFDFSRNWWFWLLAAILSFIAIVYLLLVFKEIDE